MVPAGAYLGFCQGGCTYLADLPPPPLIWILQIRIRIRIKILSWIRIRLRIRIKTMRICCLPLSVLFLLAGQLIVNRGNFSGSDEWTTEESTGERCEIQIQAICAGILEQSMGG
jgi:hypothetical protein